MDSAAGAAPKFRIVTRTFTNPSAITIPTVGKAAPYPSEIKVGRFKGMILDVNLTLRNFGHRFAADVDVLLLHGARDRTVMSDAGASFAPVANITLRLDDEATNRLPASGPLTGGVYKPTNHGTAGELETFPSSAPVLHNPNSNLSFFDGQSPNGVWGLFLADDSELAPRDPGQFAGGWAITIKARVRR